MKNILCYGDSNTWGNIAGSRDANLLLAKRFDRNLRWTGILQKILGENYHIIEAGLNGRTTAFDETRYIRPSRNGLASFPLILEMNYPLDLVVLMLGTNDAIKDYNASPEQTTEAMQKMIRYVKESHFADNFKAPKVLLVSPVPLRKVNEDFYILLDDSSIGKSERLAKLFQQLAEKENCPFLDAGQLVKVSDVDGVHLDPISHKILGEALATKIKNIMTENTSPNQKSDIAENLELISN